MKAGYLIITGLGLLFTSPQCPAQEAPLSCAYCDLRGKDLSGKNLSNANLVGSDLREAKLAGATLDGAILIGANLAGADLSGARLGSTSKGPADLTKANLTGAKFHQTGLTGAQLPFASLEGADFSGADLTGVVLGPHPKVGTSGGQRTSFRGARMDRRFGAAAMEADLSGVIWNKAKAEAAMAGPAGVTCGDSDLSAVTAPVYVSTQGSDSTDCGASPTTACKSLAHGLSRCTPTSCNLLVMYDEFNLFATLAFNTTTTPIGARLYGGCVPSGQAEAGLTSLISAPPGGVPAVSVAGINPPVMENFKIVGSAEGADPGAPALTVLVTSQVTFNNCMIVGGKGGTGAAGADQPPGVQGGAANRQAGGTNASCSNTGGGAGSNPMFPTWRDRYTFSGFVCNPPAGSWSSQECRPHDMYSGQTVPCVGASGLHGDTPGRDNGGSCGSSEYDDSLCTFNRTDKGGDGLQGVNAACGSGGAASSNTEGSFIGANWSLSAGGAGTKGGNGGGGGGGGAGGASAGLCIMNQRNYPGGNGGAGGAGGCGGQPAPGGQQGGASFAIVAAFGSVLTLNHSRVVAGRGGDGGRGGVGGAGGLGGSHATGGNVGGPDGAGTKGGDGGDGGIGGGGGGGAGGNGGPSAAVALVGGAEVEGDGISYYKGSSGDFSDGGAGGTNPVCPTGPQGKPGILGNAAETLTYP
jgi:uncharacterized protein YjbI with pentapeptide repeats